MRRLVLVLALVLAACGSGDDDDDDSSSVFDLCGDAAESYIRECHDPLDSEHEVNETAKNLRSWCSELSAESAADASECFNAADNCEEAALCQESVGSY